MRIALLGDMALIGRYDRAQTDDVNQRVAVVRELVKDCDYVIGNLESPLTHVTKTRACKGVYLRSDPVNVQTLVHMGVTHVTLANNHLYDYGKKGASETMDILRDAGIEFVGLNDGPAILTSEESKVALDGFCCLSANALNYGIKPGQVKMLSRETMQEFLVFARGYECLPIASVHYGLEGLHYPSHEHMALFRGLAKEFNYVLHGNHPHAIQGYETCNSSLLIYAQGNLCFDETPVTSIHMVPEEKPEDRKCYVSILEIDKNEIVSHRAIALTDLDGGVLRENSVVQSELKQYTTALCSSTAQIQQLRDQEIEEQRTTAQRRDLRFYLDRLNYKYIGAYLNGRRHAKQYSRIISQCGRCED